MASAQGQSGARTPQTAPKPVKVNKDGSVRKAPVRRERPALDLSKLTVTQVNSADTMRAHRRERVERDREQRIIDDLVRKAHEGWVEQGRPEAWVDARGIQLRVPEPQRETLEWRIRRAGQYFDMAIRFGKPLIADGYATLVFVAKDRPVKEEKNDDAKAGN